MLIETRLHGKAMLELGPDVIENLKAQAIEDLRSRVAGSVSAVYGQAAQIEVQGMLQDELYRVVKQEVAKDVSTLDIEAMVQRILKERAGDAG